jgi:hypothetical protein
MRLLVPGTPRIGKKSMRRRGRITMHLAGAPNLLRCVGRSGQRNAGAVALLLCRRGGAAFVSTVMIAFRSHTFNGRSTVAIVVSLLLKSGRVFGVFALHA